MTNDTKHKHVEIVSTELSGVRYRRADEPYVPAIDGVDFAPYQEWAETTLGYTFHDPTLLVTALTHRSYVNEHRRLARSHNERLEFLGDAVLELVVI